MAWARLLTSSLRRIAVTCAFTVMSEMARSRAIPLFDIPRASRSSTVSWREVSAPPLSASPRLSRGSA